VTELHRAGDEAVLLAHGAAQPRVRGVHLVLPGGLQGRPALQPHGARCPPCPCTQAANIMAPLYIARATDGLEEAASHLCHLCDSSTRSQVLTGWTVLCAGPASCSHVRHCHVRQPAVCQQGVCAEGCVRRSHPRARQALKEFQSLAYIRVKLIAGLQVREAACRLPRMPAVPC